MKYGWGDKRFYGTKPNQLLKLERQQTPGDEVLEKEFCKPNPKCELCGRTGVEVTRHHLIPRAVHKKPRTAKRYDAAELTGRIALFCRPCHKFVHSVLNEKQLASDYSTVNQLLAHPDIRQFVGWISNKPAGLSVSTAKRSS